MGALSEAQRHLQRGIAEPRSHCSILDLQSGHMTEISEVTCQYCQSPRKGDCGKAQVHAADAKVVGEQPVVGITYQWIKGQKGKAQVIARQAFQKLVAANKAGSIFGLIQKSVSAHHLLVKTHNAAGEIRRRELIHLRGKATIFGTGFALQNAEMIGIQQIDHAESCAISSLRTAWQHSKNC
jgi:hypothetical protein